MSRLVLIMMSAAVLSACSNIPSAQELSATRGLVLCAPTEICPIIKVNWNEQDKAYLKVDISLDDAYRAYKIESIDFSNGQQNLHFKVSAAGESKYLAGVYRSKNSVITPVDVLAQLKASDHISLQVNTDQGHIKRYLLKDGQRSSAYQQFMDYYQTTQAQ
ncbi:hypothetical protein [Acinetobacter larvae]|uniref:Lipoprotein n=1 Tax=Acinetobacter larvae TaxID=1789224 RepID=A0A1B2LVQ2_9GAMM|nr:hypothetical protein [Acinetobacter larvae]AOA57007.1 hypothetical protein BFG52_00630 [Acinetobacter larvae]